jgi:hypothetical protein
VLLTARLFGLISGQKSLAETEALTAELPRPLRRRFDLRRRVPDTTTRDTLVRLSPQGLRRALHYQVRAAHRRKAVLPDGLPFGVLALDGKSTALPCFDGEYAQQQSEASGPPRGAVAALTACLVPVRKAPRRCPSRPRGHQRGGALRRGTRGSHAGVWRERPLPPREL